MLGSNGYEDRNRDRVSSLECGAGHPDRMMTFCTRNRHHDGDHLAIPDHAHPSHAVSWRQRLDLQAPVEVNLLEPVEHVGEADTSAQLRNLLLSLVVLVLVVTLPALVIGVWRWALA